MKHIAYVTNINKQLEYSKRLEEKVKREGKEVHFVSLSIRGDQVFDDTWRKKLAEADVVILTHMGTGLDTPFMRQLASWLYLNHPRYILYVEEKEREKLEKGFSKEAVLTIEKYIKYSGDNNHEELLNYILAQLGEGVSYVEPVSRPWEGIIDKEGHFFPTYDAYAKDRKDNDKPKVGVFFYREEWISNELFYQRALYEALERLQVQPVLFFGQYGGNPRIGAPCFKESAKKIFGHGLMPLDVLINTGKFSLLGLQAMESGDLLSYNVPILQGYNIYMEEKRWEENLQGLPALDVSMSVALPEMDGAIHGGVVAGQTQMDDGRYIYLPISERVSEIAERAAKWAKLRHIPNEEKRVAIIFHNYPPKNSNIGSAAGLDSPESICRLLAAMKEEGYVIDHLPENSKDLMEDILRHATNDRRFLSEEQIRAAQGQLSAQAYKEFFQTIPNRSQRNMTEGWGEAPGEVFFYDDNLLIPGYENGNLWITVQPPRGFGEDPSKIIHDPLCPPTHHYEGFYHWIRDHWRADAVIHVGTHGSLEWLPGKGTGLSLSCYPEMSIKSLPNIYPYWTTIVGEGIQAKRRGAACLIGHLTPPMAHSGLYDAYEELDHLLEEYEHFRQQSERLSESETVAAMIIEKAKDCHLYEEIDNREAISFEELVGILHNRLTDMKHMQMRCGLHILGQPPQGEHLRAFLSGLVRVENNGLPSLPQLLANIQGEDFQELQDHSGEYTSKGVRKGILVDRIWQMVDDILVFLADSKFTSHKEWRDIPSVRDILEKADEEDLRKMDGIIETICTVYVPHIDKTVQEIDNTIKALQGQYIEAGPGGAPTGGRADVLPTGRNFYGVDERTLPTKAAYEIGTQLANQVIESFIEEEGRYPEQIGMILWAGSNTRSHGQCAAQFMNLMGVRPIWQAGSGRVVGLEAIPLHELKRPRIDVTGRISGLIRDMMPNLIKWLDKAVLLVSELEEDAEDNYIRKHIDEDVSWLVEEGEAPEDAYVKARWRIFGDPLGAYGAGIANVLEAKNWETIDDLAEVYLTWSSYSYSTDREVGQDARLFRKRLSTVEVTIKNEDNREVSMLSSDDFNSYHGGMIATVRSLSGKQPKSYCGDSSDKEHVTTRTLQSEIKRLFRGEAINPKFIEGMMEHGYKGAADMSSYVAHSYQWDATSAVMEDWMYDEYARKYVFDKKVQDWMRDVNPWALQRIAETLLEAEQRGLWAASLEYKEGLQEIYLSLEGTLEERGEMVKS